MTCRELVEILIDYLEGDLAIAETERFDSHLTECPRCAEYVDGYQKTMAAGRIAARMAEGDAPPDLASELIDRVFRARSK